MPRKLSCRSGCSTTPMVLFFALVRSVADATKPRIWTLVIGRIPPRSLENAYLEAPSRNLAVLCQDWARGSHKLLRSSFLVIA
jgi:hypothetical protein